MCLLQRLLSNSSVHMDLLGMGTKCDSLLGGSRSGQRFCTSEKLSGDVSAAGPHSEQQGLREFDGSEQILPSILDGAKQKLEEGCGGNRKEL